MMHQELVDTFSCPNISDDEYLDNYLLENHYRRPLSDNLPVEDN
jgi:hypothetical protein